jgi:hypothetical protein
MSYVPATLRISPQRWIQKNVDRDRPFDMLIS